MTVIKLFFLYLELSCVSIFPSVTWTLRTPSALIKSSITLMPVSMVASSPPTWCPLHMIGVLVATQPMKFLESVLRLKPLSNKLLLKLLKKWKKSTTHRSNWDNNAASTLGTVLNTLKKIWPSTLLARKLWGLRMVPMCQWLREMTSLLLRVVCGDAPRSVLMTSSRTVYPRVTTLRLHLWPFTLKHWRGRISMDQPRQAPMLSESLEVWPSLYTAPKPFKATKATSTSQERPRCTNPSARASAENV